jgi:hypothetical protein
MLFAIFLLIGLTVFCSILLGIFFLIETIFPRIDFKDSLDGDWLGEETE